MLSLGLENLDIGPDNRNTQSHAQRHLSNVLSREFQQPDYYAISVPCNDKRRSRRAPADLLLKLPHEAIPDEYTADDHALVEQFWDDCPNFGDNPVVTDAIAKGYTTDQIIPISLYWDGVRYTKNETFLGFYTENLLTRRKVLICAVRIRLMCLLGSCMQWLMQTRSSCVCECIMLC
jgi:hypothetical protein